MFDREQISTLVFDVLHKKRTNTTSKEGNLIMNEFSDKNTKLELAKALIEKLIGMECAEGHDLSSPAVQELNKLRVEVYNFNEEVIDEIVNSYRLAYLSDTKVEK